MEKKGYFFKGKWMAGNLVLLFFFLWHSLDLRASVAETGNTWLFGWYAGLGLLVLSAGVCLGYSLFGRRQMPLEALFAVSVLTLGGIYSLVLPPLSAPDEVSHYISAYECSNRILGLAPVNEKGLIQIRPEDAWLEDVTDVLADDGSADGGGEDPVILGQNLTEETYRQIHQVLNGEKEEGEEKESSGRFPQTGGHMASSYQFSVRTTPLAYGPQTLGFVLARLMGAGSLGLLYLGRLFNLLFFTAMGCLTLRRLPFGKTAVFAAYLLPMNLHLVSSLSYDVLITACCGYFTAVCMDLAYRAKQVRPKDVVLLAVLLGVMGPCKMVYGVIAGLCLLIPVKKFGGWGRWAVSAGVVLGAFAAAMAAVNLGTVSMYTQAENSYIAWAGETGYTLLELLHRPVHVLKMCYDTLAWKGSWLLEGMLGGSLGNQDPVLNTPAVVMLAMGGILAVLALKKPEENVVLSIGNRLWIWFLAVLLLGALMFSMLLAWTPRSASMIEGVQGRYLLPFLPAVLLTLGNRRVVRTDSDDRGLLYAVMLMDLYVVLRIFAVVCLRL